MVAAQGGASAASSEPAAAAGAARRTVKLVLDGMREEIADVEKQIAAEKASTTIVVERLQSKIETLHEQLAKWGDELDLPLSK